MQKEQRERFNKQYPNGLNEVIAYFLMAFYDIMTTEEYEKVYKYAKRRERKILRSLKEYASLTRDWFKIPIWELADKIAMCPTLVADIIAIMVMLNRDLYKGVGEDEG